MVRALLASRTLQAIHGVLSEQLAQPGAPQAVAHRWITHFQPPCSGAMTMYRHSANMLTRLNTP
jgi:hypothetical protein